MGVVSALLIAACTRKISTSRRPAAPDMAADAPATEKGTTARARRPNIDEAEARFYSLRARAEAGESVDFRELRFAWLYGPSIKGRDKLQTVPILRREMFRAIERGGDPQSVLAKAREILDIAYVDLDAHKARHQACALLHESACAELGHAIEFGMFKSVIQSGDGKSCATGWKVVTPEEEQFVLHMAGAHLKTQTMVSRADKHCDAILVERDGHDETMYFQVTELREAMVRQPNP
jgi:hypothetical protein